MSNHISAKEDLEMYAFVNISKLYEYQQQNSILSQQVKDLTTKLTGMSMASSSTIESENKVNKNINNINRDVRDVKSARTTTKSSKSADYKNMK